MTVLVVVIVGGVVLGLLLTPALWVALLVVVLFGAGVVAVAACKAAALGDVWIDDFDEDEALYGRGERLP